MMKSITSTALTFAMALPVAGLVGCATETESEKTLRKAERIEDAGLMIQDGERKEAEGKALVAKGQTLRDQGDRAEGERLIARGEAMRDEGRKLQEKGKMLRN